MLSVISSLGTSSDRFEFSFLAISVPSEDDHSRAQADRSRRTTLCYRE